MADLPTPSCRGCGRPGLTAILDLGNLPLANSLLTGADLATPEPRVPLVLMFCTDCYLVQIGASVPPARLFEHYLYASSFSDTMLAHARTLVERLIVERRLDAGSQVIEIASNDGYLLQYYKACGIPVLGIEPAANIARMADEKGIPTLVEFFTDELGARMRSKGTVADVVHAHNVFAHVPDPSAFMRGLAKILKPQGLVVIEAPSVVELIDHIEFDTIYHEHFSYFSLTAVDQLCRRNGMELIDVESTPIHGGSLRMFIGHAGTLPVSVRVGQMLDDERVRGVHTKAFYDAFAARVWALKRELTTVLKDLKSQGRSLAAYGASAKGSTLMNAFGIGAELVAFVADRSTLKQGRYTPGNHLPIVAPEALIERRPDYVLLLTWNFADEILAQQRAYIEGRGRFIVPLPTVRIIPA